MKAASEPLIARDVEYAYGPVPAVRGVSLTIEPGALVGIVGPNGSGKSTLIRLLSGYLRPQRGQMLLGSRPVAQLSARERAQRIAVVPQEMAATFDYPAIELVLMGRSPHLSYLGLEGALDLAIAREAMRQTGTEALMSRTLGALSGGERQRVLVARALAQQTPILLLDEPTAHLDLSYQIETLRLLRSLNHERGVTVVLVLHDLNLASLYCERLIMLRAGERFAEGSPGEVLTSSQLEQVYGARVWCEVHPATGRPYVLPFERGLAEPMDHECR